MNAITNPYLTQIERNLEVFNFGESPNELYDPIQYILSLGGKRLRPVLTLMTYELFKSDFQRIILPALAVEVFHNFTLMHDDIMDNAPIRRGEPTAHEKWNVNTAILSGDVMLVRAYDLLLHTEAPLLKKVIGRFNETAAQVCEGQQYDMNYESKKDVSLAQYLEMIRLKTAVLIGFSMELGSILGGADEKTCRLLYKFGESIGLGFQLMDDLLDVYADRNKFGKQVGGDIIANKKTFLLLKALEKASKTELLELNKWLSASQFDPDKKVEVVKSIYDNLDIREQTQLKIDQYFSEALKLMEHIDIPRDRRQPILNFVQTLKNREK